MTTPRNSRACAEAHTLPARWQSRERFVVLATAFGAGDSFLATWSAWQNDPQRCGYLVFMAVADAPLPGPEALTGGDAWPTLSAALRAQWPLATPDWRALSFEGGRVRLVLAPGSLRQVLPEVLAQVDAFVLDGAAPGADASVWTADVFKRLGRLAAPGATVVGATSAGPALREGLASAGFVVNRASGAQAADGVTLATYAPVFRPVGPLSQPQMRAASDPLAPTAVRHAIVVGGGLAGAAAAWALAGQGWSCTVIDRQAEPAQETSGNPAGLMHGIFNAPDSPHARWFRAAALHTRDWAAPAIAAGMLAGDLSGLCRLEARRSGDEARAQLARVGLPAEWVRWADGAEVHARTGLMPTTPLTGAWDFPGGGWLSPAQVCRYLLAQAHARVPGRWLGGSKVAQVRQVASAQGPRWQCWDANEQLLAEAPVVVLAAAGMTPLLLDGALAPPLALDLIRGQTTELPAEAIEGPQPTGALSGQGYVIPLPDGRVLCGATTQLGDTDPTLRAADQAYNQARAQELGLRVRAGDLRISGRVGWRATTADRLPLVGPAVDLQAEARQRAAGKRLDAVRHRPRLHGLQPCADGSVQRHGLYVLTGLGSRGLTSASLAAEVLAHWVTGSPCPVGQDLRDAIDVAR